MAIISDDKGRRWEVLKGDPGWGAVSLLQRSGFREIILPPEVIMTGEYGNITLTDHRPLYDMYIRMEEEKVAPDILHSVGQTLLSRLLLRDCCAYLLASAILGDRYETEEE